jgi:hypothetical protein
MHRIIFFSLFISLFMSQISFSSTSDLKKQHADFQKAYAKTLDLSKDKILFAKNFDSNSKSLKKKYDVFSKSEKTEISSEGNQMALDIEMLEPLEFLASSRMDKESCSEADLLNEMNSTSDVKTYQKIKESIQTLCK